MNKNVIVTYNKKLEEKIRNKHLIPYRVSPSIKYENGKWYYSDYWGQCFRVLEVNYSRYGVLKDCYIKWDDGNYGLICTDLDFADLRIIKDYKEIYKLDEIVNSEAVYTGAEIVYWFFTHNINCFNKKYKGFWKFIDNFSAHRIADFSKYTVTADFVKDKYINCRITKVK